MYCRNSNLSHHTGQANAVRGINADQIRNQKRMVLLPEEVGKKGFLESRSPTFRIASFGKGMRRTGLEGLDWRQKT
ncbi:hypothetical protein TNCV_4727341 [Trichonephila clavipes]|nr:hypothetical protein TNCV_4727341 [Trichonephila clavipes]